MRKELAREIALLAWSLSFVCSIAGAVMYPGCAQAQPSPVAHASARAESSAVMWLGIVENNYPSYPEQREFLRAWHRIQFPWCYPDTTTGPPPENRLMEVDVYVAGDSGTPARGGIPIPDGMNLESTVAEVRIGALIGRARVQARYRDGTARWILISLPPQTPKGWNHLELFAGTAPLPAPQHATSNSGAIEVDEWIESTAWGDTRWRAWTNTNPTGTIQGGSQPSCRIFGMPEERTTIVDGVSIKLRAGERVGKVADESRPIWCSTRWYERASDEAFLGPIAVIDQPGDRGAFIDLCLDGMVDRVLHDGSILKYPDSTSTGLSILRDLGDVNADHEGDLYIDPPQNTKLLLTKWRNNEYGIVDALWCCFAALVGEPGGEPDPRAFDAFKGAILAARHWSTVDVYHVESGPLPWMWGAPWQHCGHGNSGTGDPHRGASPSTGHFNSDGVPIIRYLVGDPMIGDAMDLVQRRTRWKVENGPGMPGIPDYTGEERAPANSLRILLEGMQDQPSDSAAYRIAAEIIVQRGALARGYLHDQDQKCKPWLAALLIEQLENAARLGIAGADSARILMLDEMASEWILDPNGANTRLIYQVDPIEPSNPWTGFWNLLAADVLRERYPALAARLYQTGSRDPWYSGDKLEWPKTLTAQAILKFGHRFARAAM